MTTFISSLKSIYRLFNNFEQNTKPPSCYDPNKINPNKVCIEIYQPVLGCDKKVYSNSCKAEAAGLLSWKPYTPAKKSNCGCGK